MTTRIRRFWGSTALLGLVATISACAATKNAPHSAWNAETGVGCKVDSAASPFTLAFPPAFREDLVRTSEKGIVILAYDCNGIRVLASCHASGTYTTMPVIPRKQSISLTSPIELQLNAPTAPGGERPPAPISFSMIVGGTVVASRHSILRTSLEGRCDGATHYLRAVDLGVIGPKGKPVPTCFSKEMTHLDQLDECAFPLRAHLTPLGPVPSATQRRGAPLIACPGGSVLVDGKCTLKSMAHHYRCGGTDVAECTEQCRLGDVSSCAALGWIQISAPGDHVPKSALDLLLRGCKAGDVTACANAAWAHSRMTPPTPDVDEADLYVQSCLRGDAEACYWIGQMVNRDDAEPKIRQMAADFLFRGCSGGFSDACSEVALLFYHGLGVEKNLDAARMLFERACTDDNPFACTNLGIMLERAEGGPINLDLARSLHERACKADAPLGCANLGFMFRDGHGVEQDFGRAAKLFDQGCKGNIAQACLARGAMKEHALGAVRDIQGAASDYEKGCTLGDASSCNEIGRLRLVGAGVERDERAAASLFEKACQGGEPMACYNLATLYEEGTAIEKNPARATELFQKACDGGYAPSCSRR